jgi:DNA-binding transcriptional ArsR family regulator
MKRQQISEEIYGPDVVEFLRSLSEKERKQAFKILSDHVKEIDFEDLDASMFTPEKIRQDFENFKYGEDDERGEYIDCCEQPEDSIFGIDLDGCNMIMEVLDKLDADDGFVYTYTFSDKDYGWVTVVKSKLS